MLCGDRTSFIFLSKTERTKAMRANMIMTQNIMHEQNLSVSERFSFTCKNLGYDYAIAPWKNHNFMGNGPGIFRC